MLSRTNGAMAPGVIQKAKIFTLSLSLYLMSFHSTLCVVMNTDRDQRKILGTPVLLTYTPSRSTMFLYGRQRQPLAHGSWCRAVPGFLCVYDYPVV